MPSPPPAALSGQAVGVPKIRTGPVEAIRALRVARRGAVKARIAALNQLHGRSASVITLSPYSASRFVAATGSTPPCAALTIASIHACASSGVATDVDLDRRRLVVASTHRTRARQGCSRPARTSISEASGTPIGG